MLDEFGCQPLLGDCISLYFPSQKSLVKGGEEAILTILTGYYELEGKGLVA